MGKRGSLAGVAVVEAAKEVDEPRKEAKPFQTTRPVEDPTPLFAAALLKVSAELRRSEPRPLDHTIDRILEGTAIDRQAFRGYLQRNFSLLRRS